MVCESVACKLLGRLDVWRDCGGGTRVPWAPTSVSEKSMSISVPSPLTSFVCPCSISEATVSISVGVTDRLTVSLGVERNGESRFVG